MSYRFDYFVGALKCPVCGFVSEPDESTGMATYIRDNPDLERLGVGSPLAVTPQAIAENKVDGYLKVNVPAPGGEIRILHPWDCPNCGTYNWAEIVVRDGAIAGVKAVPLDRETLERSHLISNEAEFTAASLANVSTREIVSMDAIKILREKL